MMQRHERVPHDIFRLPGESPGFGVIGTPLEGLLVLLLK
jgi:hypothetical protein